MPPIVSSWSSNVRACNTTIILSDIPTHGEPIVAQRPIVHSPGGVGLQRFADDADLLVDEIDSGLHYTVHKALWNLVFKISTRLNVQVFATTHSWDCVEGFQQSTEQQEKELAMLIRLENRQGHIVPILFDKERLGIATRQDIKVL